MYYLENIGFPNMQVKEVREHYMKPTIICQYKIRGLLFIIIKSQIIRACKLTSRIFQPKISD